MDPLRLCIALGPLAVYLLLMGFLNLARRPFLTTAPRDIAAIGVAVAGLILIGPIELFLTRHLAIPFVDHMWLFWSLVASLYLSTLTLAILAVRPRISLHNMTLEDAREGLAEAVGALDPQARWAGNSVVLPSLNVELALDEFVPLRSVALISVGRRQSYRGWKRLEAELAQILRRREVTPNPAGVSFVLSGLLLASVILWRWGRDPAAVAQTFTEMFGL
jgi:hypothetical protein